MCHSLEWITELVNADNRLDARRALRLSQAVATIMDGAEWGNMQQRLLDEANGL